MHLDPYSGLLLKADERDTARTTAPVVRMNARRFFKTVTALVAVIVTSAGLFGYATVDGYVTSPSAKYAVARSLGPRFGEVSEGVFRMGQPNPVFLRWIWRTWRFQTVVNLAWTGSSTDLAEQRFLEAQGVRYVRFAWSSKGPTKADEITEALDVIDRAPRPILIHCRAGRDRTGGLVGLWRLRNGALLADVQHDWDRYGLPAQGWRDAILAAAPPARDAGP